MKHQMSFEHLLQLSDALDADLMLTGDAERYYAEWSSVLDAAGWTTREFTLELDRRWSHLEQLRSKKVGSLLA